MYRTAHRSAPHQPQPQPPRFQRVVRDVLRWTADGEAYRDSWSARVRCYRCHSERLRPVATCTPQAASARERARACRPGYGTTCILDIHVFCIRNPYSYLLSLGIQRLIAPAGQGGAVTTLSQRVFPADSQAINATHDWATDTAALAPSDSLRCYPPPAQDAEEQEGRPGKWVRGVS